MEETLEQVVEPVNTTRKGSIDDGASLSSAEYLHI